jgi:hypothetical protein
LEQKTILQIGKEALNSKSNKTFLETGAPRVVDTSGESGAINDPYQIGGTKNRDQINTESEEADQQSSFLKVAKESTQEEEVEEEEKLNPDDIKFKRDTETGDEDKPATLIKEVGSSEAPSTTEESFPDGIPEAEKEAPFNWEDAEVVDCKHSFIERGDMVFINIQMNGYSETRYALSSDEFLIEIREPGTKRVHKLC